MRSRLAISPVPLCAQVNLPQLIGALGGAQNAFAVEEIGTNIGVNAAVVAVCVFLLQRDLKVRLMHWVNPSTEHQFGKEVANKHISDTRDRLLGSRYSCLS